MRVFVAAAAAAIVVLLLLRTTGGPGAPEPPSPIRRPQTASGMGGTASRSSPLPLRNVFEYAGGAPSIVRAAVATPPPPPSSAPLPSPSPLVRLVGLLRRGARLRAALVVMGETVVLAPGESSGGYSVVSIDEDDGVTLRGPDGSTVTLPSASAEAR